MTNCIQARLEFPPCRRRVEAEFSGGEVTSDGGVLLLRQMDRQLGLTAAVDHALVDPRDPERITHSQVSLLRQRIYGLCLGYEDLNDHAQLRTDSALQTALERDESLASAATLCRFENRVGRAAAVRLHKVLIEQFIGSFSAPPTELILDFDATDDAVHGGQEGRFFHGYYDQYCFLSLYVFCGEQRLVSYLRPGNIDGAQPSWAILALLVKCLRQAWPEVRIILRADSGFCRWPLLAWCERHGVGYIVGFARNSRLEKVVAGPMQEAAAAYAQDRQKVRRFADLRYAADTWDQARCVIVKAEHTEKGANPRFVVTNLEGTAQALYATLYCARGEMENRIKEQQLGLFADRTSCHQWWPNQFRLLLSSFA
jgi:hypothetical protein